MKIDRQSLLVEIAGDEELAVAAEAVAREGLTLGFAAEGTLDAWLGLGAPGAPSGFADPADHLVAGFVATLCNGERLEVRPCPRRAVGPDLLALVMGQRGRFARVESAWLRVHLPDARRVARPVPADVDPPLSAEEERLLAAIGISLSHPRE